MPRPGIWSSLVKEQSGYEGARVSESARGEGALPWEGQLEGVLDSEARPRGSQEYLLTVLSLSLFAPFVAERRLREHYDRERGPIDPRRIPGVELPDRQLSGEWPVGGLLEELGDAHASSRMRARIVSLLFFVSLTLVASAAWTQQRSEQSEAVAVLCAVLGFVTWTCSMLGHVWALWRAVRQHELKQLVLGLSQRGVGLHQAWMEIPALIAELRRGAVEDLLAFALWVLAYPCMQARAARRIRGELLEAESGGSDFWSASPSEEA